MAPVDRRSEGVSTGTPPQIEGITIEKAFPIGPILLGVVFVLAGGYTAFRGVDAKDLVRQELLAQRITTPDDASIPGVPVQDAATATSMADIIDQHAQKPTGGKTSSELDLRTRPARPRSRRSRRRPGWSGGWGNFPGAD